MKKKRLGRGLGSLIGNIDDLTQVSVQDQKSGLSELDIDRIQRGKYQPRQNFDQQSLQELADSIRSPATFTSYEFKVIPFRPHHNWLDYALRTYRIGQFL